MKNICTAQKRELGDIQSVLLLHLGNYVKADRLLEFLRFHLGNFEISE